MQKTVITFGLISGLIIVALWLATRQLWINEDGQMNMSSGMLVGHVNMIVSLSMIFFGIRQYREQHLGGKISFGKAFKVGFFIALIASVIYVFLWMVYYNNSEVAQSFSSQYMEYMKEKWAQSGLSSEEIGQKIAQYEKNMTHYENPIIMAGMTLIEILPIGLIITLISAFILKKK